MTDNEVKMDNDSDGYQNEAPKLNYKLAYIMSNRIECLTQTYQRIKNTKKVRKIVELWDENIANEPKVSHRDGRYLVFDGQHTIAARILKNHGKHLNILCKVYENLDEEEEARLFAMQTGFSSKPKSGEILNAQLVGKDQICHDFLTATQEAGVNLSLSNSHGYCRIACISCAKHLYNKLGRMKYIEAVKLVREIWAGHPNSFHCDILTGMADFVNLYHGEYQRDSLIRKMQKESPKSFLRKVLLDESINGDHKPGKMILKIYNSGRKQPLKSRF